MNILSLTSVILVIIFTLCVLIYKQKEGFQSTDENAKRKEAAQKQNCRLTCQTTLDSCSKPCKDGYQNCMNYTCQNKCLNDCRDLLPSIAPTQKDIRDYQECQQNCPAKCAPICANDLAQCTNQRNCVSTFDSCVNTCN
jgi:hypothetical protein